MRATIIAVCSAVFLALMGPATAASEDAHTLLLEFLAGFIRTNGFDCESVAEAVTLSQEKLSYRVHCGPSGFVYRVDLYDTTVQRLGRKPLPDIG